MGTFYDITGNKYGRLTVVERVPNKNLGITRWLCQCDCGKLTRVNKGNLVNGHTKSCGCYALELIRGNKIRETHGQSYTRLYHIWQSMKQRCYDKNVVGYEWYGARSIIVCEEWMTFENFYAWAQNSGYNETLTIERKDVNGNYEPSNCTWASIAEQNRNKTTTHTIKINGQEKCLREWSKQLNIPISTIVNRLNRGCNSEEALDTNYYRRIRSRAREDERMGLYLEGLDDGKAANQLGIKRVSYCAWRKRNGLPSRVGPGGCRRTK